MTITASQVWGNGLTLTALTDGVIANGFSCGPADPDQFNYILNLYGQCMLEHTQQIAALQNDQSTSSDAITALQDAQNSQGGAIATLGNGLNALTDTVNNISSLSPASGPEARAGEIASVAMTPIAQAVRESAHGTIGRLMTEDASNNQWHILVNNSTNITETIGMGGTPPKGFFHVEVRNGNGTTVGDGLLYAFAIPVYYFVKNDGTVDADRVVVRDFNSQCGVELTADISAGTVTVESFLGNGATDPAVALVTIARMNQADVGIVAP